MRLGAAANARTELKPHFWAGLALLLLGHVLIFARTTGGEHVRPFSDYWFAAIWFGYIFVLDALVYRRDGESLVVSEPRVFLAMLPISGTLWWGFEWVNKVVQNWHYERPFDIPQWWADFVAWVFFSTVIPAIWETTAWLKGTRLFQSIKGFKGRRISNRFLVLLVVIGVLSFALPMLWPLYFFPLVWGFVYFVLDPINYKRGVPSILGAIERGDWRFIAALYAAGHVCGILWEFWNFWAFPRWYYTVPFVGFLKIFEMPLLGYLGYGPFALEVFAFFWFVWGFVAKGRKGRSAVVALE